MPSSDARENHPVTRVGSDGQEIELEVPKLLKARPWYLQQSDDKAESVESSSKWQAKRDAWKEYDSSEYKKIIDNFDYSSQPLKKAKAQQDVDEKIVDTYSRSVSQPSYRNVKDTAFYLLDVGATDKFEDSEIQGGKCPDIVEDKPEPVPEPVPEPEPKEIEVPPPTDCGLAEDVLTGNHTSIYGSWYHKGRWGFSCCHQLDPDSECTSN